MKFNVNEALRILSTKTQIPSDSVFELFRLIHIDDYKSIMTGLNGKMFELIKDCIPTSELRKIEQKFKNDFIREYIKSDEKIESKVEMSETRDIKYCDINIAIDLLSHDVKSLVKYLIENNLEIKNFDIKQIMSKLINSNEIRKKDIEYLSNMKIISNSQIIEYANKLVLKNWSDLMKGRLYTYIKKRFNFRLNEYILSRDQIFRVGKDVINYSSFNRKNCGMVIDQLDKKDNKGLSITDSVIHYIISNRFWYNDINLFRLKRKLETRQISHITTVLLRLAPIFEIPEYIDKIKSKYFGINGGKLKFELYKNEIMNKIIVTEVKEM